MRSQMSSGGSGAIISAPNGLKSLHSWLVQDLPRPPPANKLKFKNYS